MATISLRSLVPEIMNRSENLDTFDADYKKLQRMHKLLCGITGKDDSTQIEESTKVEYVSLMRILMDKFATTEEGAKIEKQIRKQVKNNEKLTLSVALEDTLLEWFEEAYKEATLKSDDSEVTARYESILIQKENEELLEDIQSLVKTDLTQMLQLEDDRVINHLLADYKKQLQSEVMEEHRRLVRLTKKLAQKQLEKNNK